MTRFLLRRFMWFAITLFTVVTISFFLMRSVRGGPFDTDRALNEAVRINIEARYHLDWPLWKQYAHYVGPFNLDRHGPEFLGGDGSDLFGGVLTGDFGPSFRYRDYTVNDIIAQSLPISALLGTVAMMWALALGITTGMLSALRRGSGLDISLRLAATGGIALPNFVIAGFLVILFVFLVPLFPVAGWGSLRHMLLPGFALGAPFAAYISRLTRTGMLETLSQDHIRTAWAKGLTPRLVIMRHALKGGILPVVSYLGPATAGILTGSLVIEKIFYIPGTGSHFVNSALNRDYTLSMGVTILFTVLVYSLNLVVDLAYTLLDPRIKLEDE
ncbi:MAG: ABC transporter permease subunit [Planctomycetota bacterium]|jgi:oligopeptide transport system permease protein|nr:ABC transporter [Planctomycetota bacterium]MDP6519337.1 ABC transporter permease subunit [Planctomycetota bacterium]MDP6839133.1 ABC transporter permease subunit [Planctomycetota bacterium]MDP6955055.1 ABC transporter permease subunit [Planctomycetota bacterium]